MAHLCRINVKSSQDHFPKTKRYKTPQKLSAPPNTIKSIVFKAERALTDTGEIVYKM